jgi:hypothetical protein
VICVSWGSAWSRSRVHGVVDQTVDQELVVFFVDIRRFLLAIIRIERERTRDRGFWIDRGKSVRVEEPRLHAVIEARHDAQRILSRWPIDDIASGQEGECTHAGAGPQEGATGRLGQEFGSVLGQQFGVDAGNR